MLTFSSLLPMPIIASFIFLGVCFVDAFTNENTTAILRVARTITGGDNAPNSTIIEGSYIVLLDGKTSAANVKSIATATVATMQTLKQQLTANGTIQANPNDIVEAPVNRIWKKSIQGFLIKGVPDILLPTLRQTSGVASVEPDIIVSVSNGVRNDITKRKDQKAHNYVRYLQEVQTTPWGVSRVGGPINLITVPNPKGRIFVIDTGISTKTNDLNIDKTLSINFVADSNGYINPKAWKDEEGHGTHVAGTIAALDNGINVVGVVPGATVVAVKVMNEKGSLSDVISGVEYVHTKAKKGDVVNMSLGGTVSSFPSALNAAVESTASKGVKFALAAANAAMDAINYTPASSSGANIYTVSCYDEKDSLCSFSNYGQVVDVGGPGKDILSLSLDGGVTILSGTSMSAPHIAGLLFADSFVTDGYVLNDKDKYSDPIFVYAGAVSPPETPPSNDLEFVILPDKYSSRDTSWKLRKLSPGPPEIIASRTNGTYTNPKKKYTTAVSNLAVGSYRFDLYDANGDGLIPPAYYSLSFDNGILLKTGSSFTNIQTVFFTVKPAC
jgi:subtilisin family serine protease